MSLGQVTEDHVFSNLPEQVQRPNIVQQDGRGGVTEYSFARLIASQLLETEARLRKEGVDPALWGHTLVTEYMEMCVAARVLRRMKQFQEMVDSLFADANIKLNLFLEGFAGVAEDIGPVSTVEFDESGTSTPWLPAGKYLYDGFNLTGD